MHNILETPDIELAGLCGSSYSGGFYDPEENKILLASGIRFFMEDEADFFIKTLNHELAHWATFMYLSHLTKIEVMSDYTCRACLEDIADWASGVK
jgi:antirestriction protein ArdC